MYMVYVCVSLALFVTFSSCRPWHPFWLPQQLAPPRDLATATGSRRRGARCAPASRGARRSSSVTAKRGTGAGGALQRTSSYDASVAASLITSPSKKSVWSSGASSSSVASVSFIRPTTPAVAQARRRAGVRRQAGGAFSCRRRCGARPATPLGAQWDHPHLNPNPNPGPCPSPNPDPDPNPDPSPTVRWGRRGAGAAARSGVAQHAHRHACA